MKLSKLLLVIFSGFLINNIYAYDNTTTTSDHQQEMDQTEQSLDVVDEPNTWGIGASILISPAPYKDTSPSILPLPVISYQGEKLNISGPRVNYKFLNYEYAKTSAQLFLYPLNFRSNTSSDSQMKRLNNRNYIIMGGLNQKFLSRVGVFNFSADVDVTGQSNGFILVSRYNIPFQFKMFDTDRLILNPGIGLQYSNHLLTNYYYGISSSESNSSGLETYHPSGAISPFTSLMIVYSFSDKWNISFVNTITRLPNTITDSPMVERTYIYTSYAALVYKF